MQPYSLRNRTDYQKSINWLIFTLMGVTILTLIPNVFATPPDNKSPPQIMISEVCIKADHVSGPKWVKLRSFATNDINLKDYSLHDRTNCFYRFDTNCFVETGKTLVLYFYSWIPRSGIHVDPNSGKYTKRIVLTNTWPFSGKAVMTVSFWDKVETNEAVASNLLEPLTMEQYDYVGRLADEWRDNTGVRQLPRAVMMHEFATLHFESDEVALVDGAGKIASFVGWESGPYLKTPATSKWEKAATEAHLCFDRYSIRSINTIFSSPDIILGSCGPGFQQFARVPFGTPEDTQCKDPIQKLKLKVDSATGSIKAEVRVRSSQDRWTLVLELSPLPDFKEIVFKKDIKWTSTPSVDDYSEYARISLTDDEIRKLCKQSRWFYRARREFNDGDYTQWTEGSEIIYPTKWLATFGDTPTKMAEGLIEARRKANENNKQNKEPSGSVTNSGVKAETKQ